MAEFKGEVYRAEDGDWRWRVRAENGKIVADSGEGYENRADLLAIYAKLLGRVPVEFIDAAE